MSNDNGKKLSTRTRVEVVINEQKNMFIVLKEIKENTKDLPVLRTDLKWLKDWHNKIVIGVLFAIIVGGIALAFQVK